MRPGDEASPEEDRGPMTESIVEDESAAARADPDRVVVEVTRGDAVESRHRGAAAVVDCEGRVLHAWGDVGRPVFPRSAIKPVQAIPLVETGAAEHFGLGDTEIALACASHGGEPMHVAAVRHWLERIGLGVDDLECGVHPPSHEPSAIALWRAGETPTAVHNNCSGKHSGMLTTARHMGEPTKGYIAADHPVQRRVAAVIGEMSGADMTQAPMAPDGCSIPTIAIPLSALATAFARFAAPETLPPARAAAVRRIHRAMVARPEMIAGTGRLGTVLIRESGGAILGKTGAEGVYAAAVPGTRLGVAVKIDDGAGRASGVFVLEVLRRIGALDEGLARRLADFVRPVIRNRNGWRVGEVRPVPGWEG